MIDPKLIRKDPEVVRKALTDRGSDGSQIDRYLHVDEKWRSLTSEVENIQKELNQVSERIGKAKKGGSDTKADEEMAKALKEKIASHQKNVSAVTGQLEACALDLPNIPHESIPRGKDASQNVERRTWGNPPKFSFAPKPHFETGPALGLLDFDAAAKIAGSRLVVYRGAGAALARALITFMMDVHTRENGYFEVYPPYLVNADAARGTGQLPKFEADLFKTGEFYLVPTAEVPVTNLHRDEILSPGKLPISYVAYTACFRSEAGSYGKDVRGLIRQHQFDKVELVKFVEPEKSYEALEKLTADAESVLQKLGFHYRVVELCTGDLGFAAAKTYDLEVWFPSENRFREISSCSNFEDFQARRAGIRFRRDAKSKPELVHTLNGSGVAVGRTFAAILENYQQADGSVTIPEVLRPYLHGLEKMEVSR